MEHCKARINSSSGEGSKEPWGSEVCTGCKGERFADWRRIRVKEEATA
jgi:hypothetical protein